MTTRVIRNEKIYSPFEDKGDGLRVMTEDAIIENVLIDFKNVELDEQDEALSCVQQPTCKIYNTVIKNVR